MTAPLNNFHPQGFKRPASSWLQAQTQQDNDDLVDFDLDKNNTSSEIQEEPISAQRIYSQILIKYISNSQELKMKILKNIGSGK